MSEALGAAGSSQARGLGILYFVRVGFSAIWVVLVVLLAASATAAATPDPAAIVLLVVYPVWDAVATTVDIRAAGRTGSRVPQYFNIAFGIVAAILLAILLPMGGLTAGLIVFGGWAFLSGAAQLFLAIGRRRAVGGQWPMMISGGLSMIAGLAFAIMASMPRSGLGTLAGYSAFGAFWYLVAAVLLTIRAGQVPR